MSRVGILFVLSALLCVSEGVSADEGISLDCVVEPSMLVELSSQVNGVIESVFVDRGDFVTKDQLVAELKSGVEKASVRLSQKRANMVVDIKTREAEQVLRKNNFTQMEQLHQKKLASQHDYEDAKTASIVADFELQKAIELRRLAYLDLQRTQEVLKQRTINSTVNGVVMEVMKSPGEYVEEHPVVKVAQIDPLYIEIIVPESLYGRFKKGQQLPITIKYPEPSSYSASVDVVDSVIDASSGTFGVRLSLANPDYKIPAGQGCKVTLTSSNAENALEQK